MAVNKTAARNRESEVLRTAQRTGKEMIMQPLKNSGGSFRFRIDRVSHMKLQEAGEFFESRGKVVSDSLLVRRAFRVYAEHLEGLEPTREAAEKELAEIMKVRAGG